MTNTTKAQNIYSNTGNNLSIPTDAKDVERLLTAYQEHNRFLVKANDELKKTIDILTQDNGNEAAAERSEYPHHDRIEDFTIVTDTKGTIIESSPNTCALLGYSLAEITGKPLTAIAAPDERKQIINSLKTITANEDTHLEIKALRKDNSVAYLEILARITASDNGRISLTIRDVTKLIRIREQIQQNRALTSLGKMMAGIAHEVNNPLGSILLYSEILINSNDPSQSKKDLKVIHNEAKRAAKVLSSLLTYSRTMDFRARRVDINSVIRKALSMRQYAHKVGNITCLTNIQDSPLYISGSIPQLHQVLLNLLLNAEDILKHQNGGRIIISAKGEEGKAVISIADDGIGIPEEHLEQIFYPFFTTKPAGTSAGLGLSACHGIITTLGGIIYAENNTMGGATFIIKLPIWRNNE